MWEIKGKNNIVKAMPSTKPEYNGEWMSECYISVNVESPTPVNFEIGDYLIYRDERFEINYDPGKIKSAPRYVKGDAFKYENIKFNSLADELTRCDFLDVVLNDNQLHFTGLPKFSFYGNVQDLANRMQANLDKTYGKDTWHVIVSPEYTDRKEINVSVDTIKVQGALSILVNDFKAYYTIKERTLTIGAAGIPAGHLFKYGKGNGLYEIEQNAEADQAIVTRLRAYGSTRNLPHRYYNSLTGADGQKLIPDNMAVQYLMLPEFPYTTQDPYIDSPNIAKLGIREDSVFFDGSGELEEIYPSIEGMTAEQLKAAGVPCNSTGALDEIVSAEQMTDNGVGEINEGETQTTAKPPTFKVTLKDLGFDINDHKTTETATISFKTGMLGGRDFEIVGCKKIESGGKVTGYELELNRVYDDGIKLWFPYSAYNAQAGDKFVILYIEMPEVYIKAAAQRLKEAATEWLSKNDYSRSIYAPKVDEIFMARQHDLAMASGGKIKSLHDTLKEGMLLLFEDEDLNIDASIFIDRLTIKEEGAVPTYEVVLKEEKTVGRLDKMQNQIDSLAAGKGQGGGGYTAAQIRSMIDAYGGTRFLSKIKDDRTPYKVSSDKGFEAGNYLPGVSGGFLGMDAEGDSFAEVARLYVRVKAFFEELTVVKAGVLAGKQYITPGGGIRCTRVEEVTDGSGNLTAYRCWFLSGQDGENTECMYSSGDQAISEMFNAVAGTSNKVSNHRYWRLVTAVSNDAYTDGTGNRYGYIDLSATDCEPGSDIPQEGDEICQHGSRIDPSRQTAMVFSTVDADAPSVKLYSGIDSYSLAGKAVVSFGCDPITGRIFFRLGADGDRQYLRYSQDGGLEVAGKISSKSTYDDGSGSDATLGDVINDRIADTDILFISHTSQTSAPALPTVDSNGSITDFQGWQTTAPQWRADRYIWQTTYVRKGDGTAVFSSPTCISGRNGSSYASNIFPSKYFNLAETGARLTKAGDLTQVELLHDRTTARFRFVPAYSPIKSAGHFSVSMWAKTTSGTISLNSDINDSEWLRPTQIGTSWTRLAGTVYINKYIGALGFIDLNISGGDISVVRISDVVITPTESPLENWVPPADEMTGTSAKLVSVNADALVFSYENDFATLLSPQSITLSALAQGIANPTYQWSYRQAGQPGFTDLPAGNNGTKQTIPVSPNGIIMGNAESSTVRCTVNGTVHDEVTIVRVSSGSTGEAGANYTENLLTGTKDFTGEWNRLNVGTLTHGAYRGLTVYSTTLRYSQMGQYVRLLPGTYTFSAYVKTSADEAIQFYGGQNPVSKIFKSTTEWQRVSVTFEVATEGNFLLRFEKHQATSTTLYLAGYKVEEGANPSTVWTPAPSDGDAYTVILTNESHIFEGDTEKALAASTECGVVVYKGNQRVSATIDTTKIAGQITGKITVSDVVHPTVTAQGSFKVSVTTGLTSADRSGEITIPVTVEGKTFNKVFSWALSLEGKARSIYLRGTQLSHDANRVLKVDGKEIYNATGRGLRLVTLDRQTLDKVEDISYDVYASDAKCTELATKLGSLPDSVFATLTSYDAISLPDALREALNALGGMFPDAFRQQRRALAFIGYKGLQKGYAQWMADQSAGTATSAHAEVSVYVADGMFTTSRTQTGIKTITEQYYLSTSRETAIGSSWSDTRQPWVAGRFYWTRSKIVYTDGTVEYKGEMCATGEQGVDTFVLDLDNEMAAVACDSSGKPTVTGVLATSTARVFKGASVDTGWTFAKTDKGCSSVINASTGVLTVNGISSDTASVTVTATKSGHAALSATMSLYKVKPGSQGAQGAAAVVYSMQISEQNITRYPDGSLSANTLYAYKYSTTGASARVLTTAHYLYARVFTDRVPGSWILIASNGATTGSVAVNGKTTAVEFELRTSNSTSSYTVLDKERVPVVTDTGSIEVGTRNLLRNSRGPFQTKDDGSLGNDWIFLPPQLFTDIELQQGAVYTIRAVSDGTWTNDHSGSVSNAPNDNVTLWLFAIDDSAHQMVADSNTGSDKGTTFTWNQKTSRVKVRLNSYGKPKAFKEIMLVKGNMIASEYTSAPEDFDYLQKALENGGVVDAGLFLGSMIGLGSKSDNGYNIMSGVNGIHNPNANGGGLAFFAGGNPGAGLDESQVAFGVRMDGSGFAARKTIRFKENEMEVGEYVTLSKDGLKLFGDTAHTEQRLAVVNQSVGTESDILQNSEISFDMKPFDLDLQIAGKEATSTPVTGVAPITQNTVTGGSSHTIQIGRLTKNSTISVSISVGFEWFLAVSQSGLPIGRMYGGVIAELRKDGALVQKYYGAFKSESNTYHIATIDINNNVDAGAYTIVIYPQSSVSPLPTTTRSGGGFINGKVLIGMKRSTVLGNDGLVSVWNNAVVMTKDNLALMRAGNYALKVTPSGVQIMRDGKWSNL